MIDALIGGRVRGASVVRTSASGAPYALVRVAAADKTGTSVLCSCIAFSATAIEALQRLSDGDSVTIAGECSLKEWTGQDGAPRHGLDVTVHGVLTAYAVTRKRKAADTTPSDTNGGE